jgi:hypothetical protein
MVFYRPFTSLESLYVNNLNSNINVRLTEKENLNELKTNQANLAKMHEGTGDQHSLTDTAKAMTA